jgi:hypothetical protein
MDTKAIWGFVILVAAVIFGLWAWDKIKAYQTAKAAA